MAARGRLPPGEIEPSFLPPSAYRPYSKEYDIHTNSEELFQDNLPHRPPDYLPQPEDYAIKPVRDLLPIDYAATGRCDYAPQTGLTGIRPIADKYSITRISEREWRENNRDVLWRSHAEQNYSDRVEWNALKSIDDIRTTIDANQKSNTSSLINREKEIYSWKARLEGCIQALIEEYDLLKAEHLRLKKAKMVVQLPASIAGECLARRVGRPDDELVRDDVEEELTRELALSGAVKEQLERTLRDVANQLVDNRSARKGLEFDWSDKRTAFEIESAISLLNNRSTTNLFKAASVTFQNEQSTVELWNQFVSNIINEADNTRERSEQLRAQLHAILMNSARDFQMQCERVNLALYKRISSMEAVKQQLENQIKKIMQRLVDAENLMPKIKEEIRKLDVPMKLAQTRLDHKSFRPRIENCRDPAQYGLIEEVRVINRSVTELQARLAKVEDSHRELMNVRAKLEKEILMKRRTLEIDRDVLNNLRTRFPSANALSGYHHIE